MKATRALSHSQRGDEATLRPPQAIALVAWSLCALSIAAAIVTVVFVQLNGFPLYLSTLMISVLASATTGALIVSRRASNTIGWLLIVGALGFGLGSLSLQYALYGAVTYPGALPAAHKVGWLATIFNPLGGFCLLGFLPLLFPNGHPASPRWRPVVWCAALIAGTGVVVNTVLPGPIQGIAVLPNPFGWNALEPWRSLLATGNIAVTIALLTLTIASLATRYRHATSDERMQIKWLAYAVFAWIALVLPSSWVEARSPQLFIVLDLLIMLTFSAIPIAIGIAVLRYRLYDIDLLINRTLVYGTLTLCIALLYTTVVVGMGALLELQQHPALTLLATILIAALFAPLRDRLQRRVNRLLYGERHEPYTALARLGQRLEATLAPDAVLPTIVQTVAETLHLPYAAIVLHATPSKAKTAATERHSEASEPLLVQLDAIASNAIVAEYSSTESRHGATAPTLRVPCYVVPLMYQGDEVGRLLLAPRARNERLAEADWRLVGDLARQVGAAVHAVQLTAALQAGLVEVRRSRERLVTAQEEERRRIQRDLHDGLGPVLASMRMRLEACLDQASTPELTHDLERLDALIGQATTDIRRLVYDLRPPALDQIGLVPALRQHATRWSRETTIAVDMTATVNDALPAAIEVTIFRITSEALTNVYKHARASRVTIDLQRLGDALLLRITDDGVGGASERPNDGGGTGTGSMRERAELLGGALVLHSQPGVGTTIEVYLPLREDQL